MSLFLYRKTSAFNKAAGIITALALAGIILCRPATPQALAIVPDAEQAAPQEAAALTTQVEAPVLSASAAVVIEAHSGELIFSVNGDIPLPPASTTKIVTALLSLDMLADLEQTTTVSDKAAAVEEMSMYLRAGEELTIAELLRGALIHSGNDACYAVAEAVTGGSEPLFVYWMNQKASALTAGSVNFRNTNGLPAEGHLVSAYDLAGLTAYAMSVDFFARTVATKSAGIGKDSSYRYYKNTNKLLWLDEHIIGVKTGTTDAAGPCLVAAYADGAALYISVVFNSKDRYDESLRLLKHAAETYCLLWPVRKGQVLAFWPDEAGGRLLYAAADLCMLIAEDETNGLVASWHLPHYLAVENMAGKELGRVELTDAGVAQ